MFSKGQNFKYFDVNLLLSMAYKVVDSFIERGVDWSMSVDIIGANGKPVSLTGSKFSASAIYLLDKRHCVSMEVKVLTGTDGEIELRIPKDITKRMPPGNWIYCVRMCTQNHYYAVLEGKLIVSDRVAKWCCNS